jgi:uncharacterized protein YijF (DUF1287 family)
VLTRRPNGRRALVPALVASACLAGLALEARAETLGERIASAAERQVGRTLFYDPAYVRLDFPMGDLPIERGVCADVVIRALRAVGLDLQAEVNRDMRSRFAHYPQLWGANAPDRNIDHRRVPNLERFFERRGLALPASGDADDYRAGDIVAWRLDNGLPHIGVVSRRSEADGRPLVVHNIGAGARLEDVLFEWRRTGHYRVVDRSAPTGG